MSKYYQQVTELGDWALQTKAKMEQSNLKVQENQRD